MQELHNLNHGNYLEGRIHDAIIVNSRRAWLGWGEMFRVKSKEWSRSWSLGTYWICIWKGLWVQCGEQARQGSSGGSVDSREFWENRQEAVAGCQKKKMYWSRVGVMKNEPNPELLQLHSWQLWWPKESRSRCQHWLLTKTWAKDGWWCHSLNLTLATCTAQGSVPSTVDMPQREEALAPLLPGVHVGQKPPSTVSYKPHPILQVMQMSWLLPWVCTKHWL